MPRSPAALRGHPAGVCCSQSEHVCLSCKLHIQFDASVSDAVLCCNMLRCDHGSLSCGALLHRQDAEGGHRDEGAQRVKSQRCCLSVMCPAWQIITGQQRDSLPAGASAVHPMPLSGCHPSEQHQGFHVSMGGVPSPTPAVAPSACCLCRCCCWTQTPPGLSAQCTASLRFWSTRCTWWRGWMGTRRSSCCISRCRPLQYLWGTAGCTGLWYPWACVAGTSAATHSRCIMQAGCCPAWRRLFAWDLLEGQGQRPTAASQGAGCSQ